MCGAADSRDGVWEHPSGLHAWHRVRTPRIFGVQPQGCCPEAAGPFSHKLRIEPCKNRGFPIPGERSPAPAHKARAGGCPKQHLSQSSTLLWLQPKPIEVNEHLFMSLGGFSASLSMQQPPGSAGHFGNNPRTAQRGIIKGDF